LKKLRKVDPRLVRHQDTSPKPTRDECWICRTMADLLIVGL
jgi:hypothetical protein